MTNEITINIEELLKVQDNSITDCETIRQIGLLSCTKNDISKENRQILYRKVKREFQFCGLYPSVMKSFDILPISNQISNRKYLEKLTDAELKSVFTIENTKDLADDGIVGEIKQYILSGKSDFTMGEKINEIEKLTMMIIIDRWLQKVSLK